MRTRNRIKKFLKSVSLSNQMIVILLAALLCVFILLFIRTLFPQRDTVYFLEEKEDYGRSRVDVEWLEEKKKQYKEQWQTLPEREKEQIRKIYKEEI